MPIGPTATVVLYRDGNTRIEDADRVPAMLEKGWSMHPGPAATTKPAAPEAPPKPPTKLKAEPAPAPAPTDKPVA